MRRFHDSIEQLGKFIKGVPRWIEFVNLYSKLNFRSGDDFRTLYQGLTTIREAKVEVRVKEHVPPHFHVVVDENLASFAIEGCVFLKGEISRKTIKRNKGWYKEGRDMLISEWDSTHPPQIVLWGKFIKS